LILAWELKTDMTSASISEVVEQAVEWTGMKSVPVQDRTRLVSDNGSSYLSHAFEDHLRMLEIRHIRSAPHHPQTNGKIERFHETLKARLNLLVYTSPGQLRAAMAEFIEFYNQRSYHEGVGNVTPADVYYGRREQILLRREEQKQQTLYKRFQYNLGRKPARTTGEPEPRNRSLSDGLSHSHKR
jgi:transposase InsO family protein